MSTNANMNDYDARRKQSYNAGAYHIPPAYGHAASQAQQLRNAPYLSAANPMMPHGHGDNMASIAHGFGALSLNSNSYNASNRGNSLPAAVSSDYPVQMSQPGMYVPAGQHLVYGSHLVSGSGNNQNANNVYPHVHPYMSQPSYDTKYMQGAMQYGSENNQNSSWGSRVPSDASQAVPTLITPRRGSVSSNEEHFPATPYHTYGTYPSNVAILDRSPSVVCNNSTTPSPSSYVHGYGNQALNKPYQPATITMDLQILIQQNPPIPRAIPAPSSPVKPLDRCLENKNGETNVYIRGLLPETTDDMLHSWGSRFGDIASSKSIIDHKNNLCKGFGFIKFHNFEDAEKCIRGFHHLGYEVSFARESFYSKLKKFSDEANTNLYVSNIPRNFNEHELSQAFVPFKVCSARILRDDRGNGRGVGFARFESRDVCEDIIKTFNNTPVSKPGGEEHIMQIRYSDTHEQKMLKQQTAAARQFRAAEFEYGCLEARRAGLLPQASPVDHLQAAGVKSSTGALGNDFEPYMTHTASVYPQASAGAKMHLNETLPTIKSDNTASPGVSTPATAVKIEEGVALPSDIIDGKENAAPITNGKTASAHDAE